MVESARNVRRSTMKRAQALREVQYLGDDYGDNRCTIRCQLARGHEGQHREICRENTVRIEWAEDERCRTFVRPTWDYDDTAPDGYFEQCETCRLLAEEHVR